MEKLPQIQVARAIAALMVVVYHSYMGLRSFNDEAKVDIPFIYSWGFLGVNLFFTISGFIISLVLDRPGASVKTFFAKRFFRIYPLYWLFIAAAMISGLGFGVFQGSKDLSPLSILKNLFIFPIQGEPLYAVGWSLEHEILFYVLAGLLISLRSLWWVFAATVTLGVLGAVLNISWGYHLFASANLDFAVGILVYLLRHRIKKLGVAIPLVIAVDAYVLGTSFKVPYAPLAANAGLLIALLNLSPEFVSRYLSPLVRIGDVSYSLYLGHWLIISLAALAGAALTLPDEFAEPYRLAIILVSIGFANLLYEAVEKPLIRLGHRRFSGAGPEAVAVPVAEGRPATSSGAFTAVWLGLASLVSLLGIAQLQRFASADRALPALITLSTQLDKLPKKLESHRHFGLQDLRAANVDLPGPLVGEDKLVTPWKGALSVSKVGDTTYIDLYGLPHSTCAELLQKANLIPRVTRAAASGSASDERPVPVDPEQARKDSRRSTFVRLIRID